MSTFASIDEVVPPVVRVGDPAIVLSNGTWESADVSKVEIHRITKRRRSWCWWYHVTIRGVSVIREEPDIKACEIK